MQYSLNDLWVNYPIYDYGNFELPEVVYLSYDEALNHCEIGYTTTTLADAFREVSNNIHEDA